MAKRAFLLLIACSLFANCDTRPPDFPPESIGFIVDSTADAEDRAVGDGTCETSLQECTLRAAIQEANATPGLVYVYFDIPGPTPHTIGRRKLCP